MSMKELLPNVYMVEKPVGANCYLVHGDGETTLIDTGMRRNLAKVQSLLREAGVAKGGLKNIVITHAHYDHFQALAGIVEEEGGSVMVHDADADYITGTKKVPLPNGGVKVMFYLMSPMLRSEPAIVSKRLKEGDKIDCLGGLEVLHLPGHTPGNIALYAPKRKLLFCGDTINNRKDKLGVPFQYKYHKEECERAFDRMAWLEFTAMLPGHGPPIMKDADKKVREFAERTRL